ESAGSSCQRGQTSAPGFGCTRHVPAEAQNEGDHEARNARPTLKADARTRTGDPFITSEVLYQLSYVGRRPTVARLRINVRARRPWFRAWVKLTSPNCCGSKRRINYGRTIGTSV